MSSSTAAESGAAPAGAGAGAGSGGGASQVPGNELLLGNNPVPSFASDADASGVDAVASNARRNCATGAAITHARSVRVRHVLRRTVVSRKRRCAAQWQTISRRWQGFGFWKIENGAPRARHAPASSSSARCQFRAFILAALLLAGIVASVLPGHFRGRLSRRHGGCSPTAAALAAVSLPRAARGPLRVRTPPTLAVLSINILDSGGA